jgi:hypothetical protein
MGQLGGAGGFTRAVYPQKKHEAAFVFRRGGNKHGLKYRGKASPYFFGVPDFIFFAPFLKGLDGFKGFGGAEIPFHKQVRELLKKFPGIRGTEAE